MDGSQYHWINYLGKICTIVISRHIDERLVVLVNDTYDRPFSIKDDEHDRRATRLLTFQMSSGSLKITSQEPLSLTK